MLYFSNSPAYRDRVSFEKPGTKRNQENGWFWSVNSLFFNWHTTTSISSCLVLAIAFSRPFLKLCLQKWLHRAFWKVFAKCCGWKFHSLKNYKNPDFDHSFPAIIILFLNNEN